VPKPASAVISGPAFAPATIVFIPTLQLKIIDHKNTVTTLEAINSPMLDLLSEKRPP